MSEGQNQGSCSRRFVDRFPLGRRMAVGVLTVVVVGLAASLSMAKDAETVIEAISACRLDAPRIARRIGQGGTIVGRTSHRLRNPDNAPEDWMKPLLTEYLESEPAPGSFRTVDLGSRGIATVEPIYLKPLCATCHGENLDPALLASIREQYPKDKAVGFRVGEFRGLFWSVTKAPSTH